MISLLAGVVMLVSGLVQAPPRTAKAPEPTAETATQFYLRYRAAVANAASVDEVLAFWADAAATEYRSAPADQRVDLAAIKRMNSMVTGVTVTREDASSAAGTDHVILSLEGSGLDQKKVTGTAHLVKEAGAWRLAEPEEWK
jgi:hypothetical protein